MKREPCQDCTHPACMARRAVRQSMQPQPAQRKAHGKGPQPPWAPARSDSPSRRTP